MSGSPATKVRLKNAADRGYGGNVSALIEAIALDADRQHALDLLIHRVPPIEDRSFDGFMSEMEGTKRKHAHPVLGPRGEKPCSRAPARVGHRCHGRTRTEPSVYGEFG